jgi:hypothetical protein
MAFDLLTRERLPFSYSEEEEPRSFRVIEPGPDGSYGLRFYHPSIHRGCIAQYGEVPLRPRRRRASRTALFVIAVLRRVDTVTHNAAASGLV